MCKLSSPEKSMKPINNFKISNNTNTILANTIAFKYYMHLTQSRTYSTPQKRIT